MSKKKKEEYITVTGLIEKRGWTRTMAKKLLQNLDYKIVDNPMYKCAAPMTLYYLKDIRRIERTKKYKELKEKADKRKEGAKKAVQTKTSNAIAIAGTFSVKVERIDLKELEEETIMYKQWWNGEPLYYTQETLDRWKINFIRHNLSNYDEELEKLKGRTGKFRGYVYYKMKLAEEMKRVYPELAKEINRYMLGIKDEENIDDSINNVTSII